jgi:membrane-bound serine protease (ClpP class)
MQRGTALDPRKQSDRMRRDEVVRTLARRLAATLLLVAGVLLTAASPSGAQASGSCADQIHVAEVSGLLDPVLVDFVERTVQEADACGAVAVVLQIDSSGGVVDDQRFEEFLDVIRDAEVPVTAWVGPAGSEARNEAFELVEATDVKALAPESRLQAAGGRSFGSEEAVEAGLTDFGGRQAATLGDFIVSLSDHGIPVEVDEIDEGDETRRVPVTQTVFAGLPLIDQLAHTVASPPTAYLLFVIGMALLLFELFTAGVGVAGVVGATFFLMGSYGLAVLPANAWAVALLVVAMFGFGVDVQTGVPRVWTGIGAVAYLLGSVFLYDGLSLSWITLLVSILGMMLAMLAGMPAMVRSRFSTPTIGREWMIGEEGVAATAVDPDGTVLVRDAPWRARTNRATPIAGGEAVRVASIDGLVLEVEPLEGAAREHRG